MLHHEKSREESAADANADVNHYCLHDNLSEFCAKVNINYGCSCKKFSNFPLKANRKNFSFELINYIARNEEKLKRKKLNKKILKSMFFIVIER